MLVRHAQTQAAIDLYAQFVDGQAFLASPVQQAKDGAVKAAVAAVSAANLPHVLDMREF